MSKKKIRLTNNQLYFLKNFYLSNPRPDYEERTILSRELFINEDKIKNWFQNMRAKERKSSRNGPCLKYSSITTSSMIDMNVFPDCNDLYKKRDSKN